MDSNEEILREANKSEWENISIKQCKKLTDNMPKIIALFKNTLVRLALIKKN